MGQLLNQSGVADRTLSIDEIGANLNISSTGEEMRLLVCPSEKCGRLYIREHKETTRFAKCVCGVRIQLKKRWYD